MDELRREARAAWAIARKELRISLRYRLNAVNEVLQPIYRTRARSASISTPSS